MLSDLYITYTPKDEQFIRDGIGTLFEAFFESYDPRGKEHSIQKCSE